MNSFHQHPHERGQKKEMNANCNNAAYHLQIETQSVHQNISEIKYNFGGGKFYWTILARERNSCGKHWGRAWSKFYLLEQLYSSSLFMKYHLPPHLPNLHLLRVPSMTLSNSRKFYFFNFWTRNIRDSFAFHAPTGCYFSVFRRLSTKTSLALSHVIFGDRLEVEANSYINSTLMFRIWQG